MTQMIMELDVPNKNDHIYPRIEIERVVERWTGNPMFGQIEMPPWHEGALSVD